MDLRKVNVSVLRPWIAKTVTERMRIEDDIVVEYAFSMLEDTEDPFPDPRKMQVNLSGFMDKISSSYLVEELWKLLLSAQETVGGVPAEVSCRDRACCTSRCDMLVHVLCGYEKRVWEKEMERREADE